MPGILIMTIDTLIQKLKEARDLHDGNTEVQLENFTTTTTTATEDLLKNTPIFAQTNIVKIILTEKVPGEIELTSVKEVAFPLAD